MEGSFRLLRQIAQFSAHISHDHMATAFHFFISNLFVFAPDFFGGGTTLHTCVLDMVTSPSTLAGSALAAGGISTLVAEDEVAPPALDDATALELIILIF